MAIKATGLVNVGNSYYKDPEFQLVPHLTYRGGLTMDAHVHIANEASGSNTIQVTTTPYYIELKDLTYPTSKTNPYTDLIKSLESYVIADLTVKNPEASFTTF